MTKHRVSPEYAPLALAWLSSRAGLLVWASADLCDPGKGWTTPATDADGKPAPKPSWQAAEKPARHITDAADVEVVEPRLVRRLRVAIRIGQSGTRVKLTDTSSRTLRDALDKAGPDSWYEFAYDSQEALIFKPGKVTPLTEWGAR
jgi:hypothetical protein